MKWLIEHAASVHIRFAAGDDGKTPYERSHGTKAHDREIEFGEKILWFVPKRDRGDMDPQWRFGVVL